MKVSFNTSEFEHLKSMSVYNNNFYKHKVNGFILLEICHEDENFCEYKLIDNGEVFLGCSSDEEGFGIKDVEVSFEFGLYFT